MHQIQNPTLSEPSLVNPTPLKTTCSAGLAAETLPAGIVVNASVITTIAARLATLRLRLVLVMFMVFSPFESSRLTRIRIKTRRYRRRSWNNKCRSSLTREASTGRSMKRLEDDGHPKNPVALTQPFDWGQTLEISWLWVGNYTRIRVFVITENLKKFALMLG